ncbi:hypothetical protein KDN24_20840 [Bacillus sp. Bva_UNVM-123]|uniref:hypothetical protein n=1 Tax=Bacillus sp. Bva_UNVM-123 TaxID=2829798 RepID=UPI00391F0B34
MKKTFLGLMIGMLLVFSLPILVGAASEKTMNEKEILMDYLKAVKNENIDKVIELVNDSRYESIDQQKVEYQYFLSKDKLEEFTIIESKSNNEFIVLLHFENGEITQAPFKIISNKVDINPNSLDNSDNEVIKEGIDISIRPMHTLVDWNFSGARGGSEFYSIGKFDIVGTSVVELLLTQYTDTSKVPAITYSIVDKRLFGDDIWGSGYVSGTYKSAHSTFITGKNSSFKGAQVRFNISPIDNISAHYGIGSVLK